MKNCAGLESLQVLSPHSPTELGEAQEHEKKSLKSLTSRLFSFTTTRPPIQIIISWYSFYLHEAGDCDVSVEMIHYPHLKPSLRGPPWLPMMS
jgi:hypothetical protein